MKKDIEEIKLQAKESARWLLSQDAIDSEGQPVVLYGKPLNNMELILNGLLRNAGSGNVAPAMNLLTVSGVLGDGKDEKDPDEMEAVVASSKRYKKQLQNIKNYITKKLKEAGTFDNTITYAIELAAVNILLFRKMAEVVLPDSQNLVIIETSREGATRMKASPLLGELQRQMEKTLMSLKALSMTVNNPSVKAESEDSFMDFINKIGSD